MNESEQVKEFDLHGIFNKKNSMVDSSDENIVEDKPQPQSEQKKPEKKDLPKKEEPVKQLLKSKEQNEDDDEEEPSDVKKESPKEKEIDYKSENLKLQKVIKDTQKSFHEDRKKLSAYKKAVEKMKEDMILTDEDAEILLNHTAFEDNVTQNEHVMDKYARIWDNELQHMRKYPSHFPNIDQYIHAFQHLMQTSSIQEIEEIMSDLSNYEDDEVELTNRMLEYGRQYNEEIYSDINESGSIRKLKEKYQKEREEIQEELDKWKRKYNKLKEKHQDYDDKPSERIRSGIGHENHKENVSFNPSDIFKKLG